jgi:hypothetical protein
VVHVDVCVDVDVDVCVSGAELFPAINFYSSDRELQLELVEVAGAAIIDCGLKSEGPADTAVPVAAAAATTVPTTVYTAIAGGLFDGGLLLPVEQTDSACAAAVFENVSQPFSSGARGQLL